MDLVGKIWSPRLGFSGVESLCRYQRSRDQEVDDGLRPVEVTTPITDRPRSGHPLTLTHPVCPSFGQRQDRTTPGKLIVNDP